MTKQPISKGQRSIILVISVVLLSSFGLASTIPLSDRNLAADSPPQIAAGNDLKNGMLPYHELPVYGNASLGYYYVKIFLGTPNPQPQSVIVDTGSGLLAVPGINCSSCNSRHLDPPYDPAKSQSSQHLFCVTLLRFSLLGIGAA